MATIVSANPSAWNIGAATWVASRALNGTFERIAPIGASERPWWRGAPFGAPVVPLVNRTTAERRSGAGAT